MRHVNVGVEGLSPAVLPLEGGEGRSKNLGKGAGFTANYNRLKASKETPASHTVDDSEQVDAKEPRADEIDGDSQLVQSAGCDQYIGLEDKGLVWKPVTLLFSIASGEFGFLSGIFGFCMWVAGGVL
ncbi:hypothetical protein SUGI_1038080 [Cryptomeria japonica]|nr:hypothetical protein SUGI_1038080 [Cryptomeria japonica]